MADGAVENEVGGVPTFHNKNPFLFYFLPLFFLGLMGGFWSPIICSLLQNLRVRMNNIQVLQFS